MSHSFSPGYFSQKFEDLGLTDHAYDLYPLPHIEAFDQIENVGGLNVTIPYKEKVIPYLSSLSPEAEEIGAVNTILFRGDERIGYNTDVYGFEYSLVPLWEDQEKPKSALVLGTGGAAKAVWFVLDKLGISYLKVSRSKGDLHYDDIDDQVLDEHRLIINTTPLGMNPHIDTCPDIPYDAMSLDHILFDLIYNPAKTLFLKHGEERRATIKNGLEMLELQAEKSWSIWTSENEK